MKRSFKTKNKWYKEWVHTADLELKDGNRDTIIEWIYKSNLVPWYVTYILEKPIDNEYVQDCIGELYLMICEIPQEKWDKLYEQGKMSISAYITGIIQQQVISTNSRIYKLLGKHKAMEIIKKEEFWIAYADEH